MDKILEHFPQRFIENPEYAYSLGRVRSLEIHILDISDYERMANSDIKEIPKILVESDFSMEVNLLLNQNTLENTLNKHKMIIFGLMDELIPEERIKISFRMDYDFYNAKILLLEKIFDIKISEPLPFGNINPDRLKYILTEEKYELLPDYLKDAVQEAIKVYYDKKEKRFIDFVFDKSYLDYICVNSYPPFLQDYFRILADISNLSSLIRIKYMNEDLSLLNYILSEGGFIPLELLFSLSKKEISEIPNYMKRWIYFKPLDEGVKFLNEKNSFVKLENLFNKLVCEYLDTTKYISLGPEPVVAYILKKLIEIKNIRIVLIGKFYNVKNNEIIERIIV